MSGALIFNSDYDGEGVRAAAASRKPDAISFGTSFLANPDLPARLAKGALNLPNGDTFYGGGAKGYTDYPALARPLAPADRC